MGRIEQLCSYLDPCGLFADVGCDHGFCTEYMLKNGKCSQAIISDISAKSLKKAEILLDKYIKSGVCRSVCCDGLKGIDKSCNEVLIAGMGGMEIIKVLKESFIPEKFVLQPMKNVPAVRRFLIESGCRITADDMFKDDNYYFIIKGESSGGKESYSKLQFEFGRDSLKNPVFRQYATEELAKKTGYIKGCKEGSDTKKIDREIQLLKEALK